MSGEVFFVVQFSILSDSCVNEAFGSFMLPSAHLENSLNGERLPPFRSSGGSPAFFIISVAFLAISRLSDSKSCFMIFSFLIYALNRSLSAMKWRISELCDLYSSLNISCANWTIFRCIPQLFPPSTCSSENRISQFSKSLFSGFSRSKNIRSMASVST